MTHSNFSLIIKKKIISKKLQFAKVRPEFLDVVPIKTSIPKWYKDTPPKMPNGKTWDSNTMKTCMPFLDSLTTGYVIPLPVDIVIERRENGSVMYGWADPEITVVRVREPDFMPLFPMPQEYDQAHTVWALPCALELPKGYSMLITHPLNRLDLPFTTLSGIVDDFKMPPGSLPVLFKESFTGLIPAGTPIAQIIPFKRENWRIEESSSLLKEATIIGKKSRNALVGFYKHTYWNKKNYD